MQCQQVIGLHLHASSTHIKVKLDSDKNSCAAFIKLKTITHLSLAKDATYKIHRTSGPVD
jgi:hypothetical protein